MEYEKLKGAGVCHGWAPDLDEAQRIFAEAKEARRIAHKARIEERRLQRLAEHGKGPQFIGPPNPFAYRKGRPVFKADRERSGSVGVLQGH